MINSRLNGRIDYRSMSSKLIREEISEHNRQHKYIMGINITQQWAGTKADNTPKYGVNLSIQPINPLNPS